MDDEAAYLAILRPDRRSRVIEILDRFGIPVAEREGYLAAVVGMVEMAFGAYLAGRRDAREERSE